MKRIIASLVSALLVIIGLRAGQPVNPDGILYIHTAMTYLHDGVKAMLTVYSWPFYPLLIAFIHQLTTLSLLHSGYLLSILLVMTVTYAFMTLTRTINPSAKLEIISALVIIGFPALNRTGLMLTRDVGFWAFLLIALIQLVRYVEKKEFKNACGFNLSMMFAILFRVEGGLIYLLVPFFLWLVPNKNRISFKSYLSLSIFAIIGAAIAATYFSLHKEMLFTLRHMINASADNYQHMTSYKLHALKQYVLNPMAQDNGAHILIGGSLFIVILQIFRTINIFYFVSSIYGYRFTPTPGRLILANFLWVNLLILFSFSLIYQFLELRYVVPACLPLLVFASFGLTVCYENYQIRKTWLWPFVCLCFLCIYAFIIIHPGRSKHYLVDAGEWMQNLPPHSKVYSNSDQIIFYYQPDVNTVGQKFDNKNLDLMLANKKYENYDYIALKLSKNETIPKQFRHYKVLKEFNNNRGDRAFILQAP